MSTTRARPPGDATERAILAQPDEIARLARERGRDADIAITGSWQDDGLWALGAPSRGIGRGVT